MSGSGDEGDDFDPSQPMPRSNYFGNDEDDQGGDEDDGGLDPEVAAALANFDENEDLDALPAFANAENKSLDAQVRSKEKLIQQHAEDLSENTERVTIMHDHLKNVEQEHFHTQALVDSKQREIDTETHLKQLAERESGRLVMDVVKVEKKVVEAQDSLNAIQNSMFASNEKLEQFKLQMGWNQEALLQWSLAAKQKDEDRSALEKYEQIDNVKIKNMTLKLEKAARAVQDARTNLNNEVTESQAVQIELDKTADEYRKLHTQRQDLVKQWNASIEGMMKRDRAIAATGEQIANVKKESREKGRVLAEVKEFLSTEQTNTKQLSVNLDAAGRAGEKRREYLMHVKREVVEFEDEVATQRSELERVESDLHGTERMTANLKQLREQKQRELEDYKQQFEVSKNKLANEFATTDDLQERAKQVDALHAQHETRLKKVTKELEEHKKVMFKHSNELFKLRKEEADMIAEISGAQGTSRNLQSRIHELDQRSLHQQEMLYNIEFQVQQLERKVTHASGKRSLEDTMRLNAEIVEMQKVLDQTVAQHSMIGHQVKRLREDVKAANRKYQEVCTERDRLQEKIVAVEMENDSSAVEVKEAVRTKEEMVVSHDVLKLEVKKLRDTLTAKADEVLALENRKLQLELSMKEREKEVDLHQQVQRAEMKGAEEARHNLCMDLKERQIKVEKLQSKFEIVAGRMKGADGDEGGERSQAFFIIQAAQEREELQKEGDELNRNIRRCEKEIRMLTKTLDHLSTRNQAYRESFHKANPQGPEAKLQADLEEQHRSVSDNLYKQKSYLREISTDFQERKRILSKLVSNVGVMQNEVEHQARQLDDVQERVAEQEEQLEQAAEAMEQKMENFHRARGMGEQDTAPEDVHIQVQEMKRKNRVLLNLLRSFTEEHPNMIEAVTDTLDGVGLRLAQRPSSSGSNASRPYSGMRRPGTSESMRRPGTSDSMKRPGTGNSRGSLRSSRPTSSRRGDRPADFELPPV